MVMDSIVIAEEFKNFGQIVVVYQTLVTFRGTLKAEEDTAQDGPGRS